MTETLGWVLASTARDAEQHNYCKSKIANGQPGVVRDQITAAAVGAAAALALSLSQWSRGHQRCEPLPPQFPG